MKIIALAFVPLLTALVCAQAPTPADPAPEPPQHMPDWNIQIELQVVTMPEARALPLIAEFRDAKKADAAYEKVQRMLERGQAKLAAWPIATTKSGQRVNSEEVSEYRYPINFAPPKVVYLPSVEAEKKEPERREKPAPEGPKPPETAPLVRVNLSAYDPVPSEFETRNCGVILDAEPKLSADGKLIDLEIATQHVQLIGMDKTSIELAGRKVTVEQPRIESYRERQNLTVRNGQHVLLGTFRTAKPAGAMELFLFQARAYSLK